MTDSITNTGAVGTFQYSPYSYYDFDDLDMNYSSYPMAMGGSIFDGYSPMMPMMGMGMGNNQSYFDNMKDYQRFYVNYNIDQQKMQRNADLRVNASLEAIKGTAAVLKDKVVNNEQDQIQEAFERYVTAVRAAYGDGTDSEIKARALTLYAQMNGGKTLYQDLRDYGHGSFTQGAIQAMTFSTYSRKSAEDNISLISGAPVGTGEKTKHNVGRLVGAGLVGAGAYGATKALTLSSKVAQAGGKLAKLGGKAGVVGLIVGGLAAGLSFLTGKVST